MSRVRRGYVEGTSRVHVEGVEARAQGHHRPAESGNSLQSPTVSLSWSTWSAVCSLMYPGSVAIKRGKSGRTEGSGCGFVSQSKLSVCLSYKEFLHKELPCTEQRLWRGARPAALGAMWA